MGFVVLNDFSDDEVQELLGKFRVEVGPVCQIFKPCDLVRFAGGIGRWKVVCGLEFPHGLRVFEPLAQRVDEDRVEAVDAGAVLFEHLGGAGHCVGHLAPFVVQNPTSVSRRYCVGIASVRLAVSIKGPSFRFEHRIGVVTDLHLDPVRQLAVLERIRRRVAVDGVRAIDRLRACVFDRAQPFGQPDAVEVFGVDIADRAVPAVCIVMRSHGMGGLKRVAFAGFVGPDDPGDLALGPACGLPAARHAVGLIRALVVDHPHAKAANVPMPDLGGVEHPRLVGV
mmetsp:Transcript_23420/g.41062  ORF Transcript_23420/g.41062 Transcript_23420/m.41062 type:complete len:282 (+) Transcript_23420:1441-2286(+)